MKLSAKRESILELLYEKGAVPCHSIEDKRSINWLVNNGFAETAFSTKAFMIVAKITQKGADYLKSQPAFR